MEKRFEITGVEKEELDKALELYFSMFMNYGSVEHGMKVYCLFDKTTYESYLLKNQEDDEETIDEPELHFYKYDYDKKDKNHFPCEMHKDTLVNFIWEWLQTQKINYNIDTDGSLGRGWTIIGSDCLWQYEDNPSLVVKFTTMVYGK